MFLIEVRKVLQRGSLIRQTLEDKRNFNECRWREKTLRQKTSLSKGVMVSGLSRVRSGDIWRVET